jgi:C-terminal processing protease CtpA/Prc
MLAAVGPILDTGVAGRFVSKDGSVAWGYRPGVAWSGPNELVRILRPVTLRTRGAPVAVLTDSLTGSSGEAIAVAFRARPAARSFGRPTAGASTANENFLLADGAQLFLTTAVFADRSGRAYGKPLIPDEIVRGPGVLRTSTRDRDLKQALTWLRRQPGCLTEAGLPGDRLNLGWQP